MEVDGQLHASATLHLGKEPVVPINRRLFEYCFMETFRGQSQKLVIQGNFVISIITVNMSRCLFICWPHYVN